MPASPLTDQARPARPGEELDTARLEAFLIEQVPGAKGPLVIKQFPSGHSNLTYLLTMGDAQWVLRRPPFGSKVKTAHDMGREYRILSKLYAVWPKVPRTILYAAEPSLLGSPFYVMERIPGVILRSRIPEGLDTGPGVMSRLGTRFIDTLAELHMLDYQKAGLGDLGKPEGYVERQVSGWTRRYADSKTDDIPNVTRAAEWLKAKVPPQSGAALIHNDFKYDNLILDPAGLTRIVGVLDWEMSTLGDPLMDLGTALGYWIEAGDSDELKMVTFGPTSLPGSPTRKELADRYAEKTGADLSNLPFYYVFALFKTAVVAQQIYFRYKQGLTKDDRFANMIFGVQILAQAAVENIEKSGL